MKIRGSRVSQGNQDIESNKIFLEANKPIIIINGFKYVLRTISKTIMVEHKDPL
jgi:hypothetical protein